MKLFFHRIISRHDHIISNFVGLNYFTSRSSLGRLNESQCSWWLTLDFAAWIYITQALIWHLFCFVKIKLNYNSYFFFSFKYQTNYWFIFISDHASALIKHYGKSISKFVDWSKAPRRWNKTNERKVKIYSFWPGDFWIASSLCSLATRTLTW